MGQKGALITFIGTRLKRNSVVRLTHMVEGEWVSLSFYVQEEDVSRAQADRVAKAYRKAGYLARVVKRSYHVRNSWYVAVAKRPRLRKVKVR